MNSSVYFYARELFHKIKAYMTIQYIEKIKGVYLFYLEVEMYNVSS